MGPEAILIMLFLAKHLICDFWLQNNWMASNKHQLTHIAGHIHALTNVMGSFWAVILYVMFFDHQTFIDNAIYYGNFFLLFLITGEYILHFLTNFTKMNVSKMLDLHPMKHELFWDLLGADQFVHLIYLVFMAGMLV